MKKIGSMKTLCMEARVKITHIIVVGANCLSSSLIRALNDEGASCQELFTQDCEEDLKHEDNVYESKGQYHLLKSSWCKLPEFISYKELWMMKVLAVKNYLLKIVKKIGSMKTLCVEVRVMLTHLIVVGAWIHRVWKKGKKLSTQGQKEQNCCVFPSWNHLGILKLFVRKIIIELGVFEWKFNHTTESVCLWEHTDYCLWRWLEAWKHCVWKLRVKITHVIVVGANCLSSSLIKSLEWWRCQLSRTIYSKLWRRLEAWRHCVWNKDHGNWNKAWKKPQLCQEAWMFILCEILLLVNYVNVVYIMVNKHISNSTLFTSSN